jgi:hypothetical protein
VKIEKEEIKQVKLDQQAFEGLEGSLLENDLLVEPECNHIIIPLSQESREVKNSVSDY